ncbi:MAG: hypothetical protein NW206_19055 [Hyphomonadaceae bacterium]|nr:hypothetical protein [Hyphomonadaceae bacterium]
MKRLKSLALAALTSWWLIGAIGWGVVAFNYPIDQKLPTYAE